MNNFQEMGLSPILTQALDNLGFTQPTSIQAKTIPLALQQKDILGSAQTGTGKTLAFALPLVNQLLNNPIGIGLILTPTRELAQQVMDHIKQLLGAQAAIKMALLIGGDPYAKQMAQLRGNLRIIIGTPGRIIDHLARRSFKADAINFLVLDETDRMFDLGFSIQLQEIVSQLPVERQTLMFSATFSPQVEKLAAKYMQHPERVFVNESNAAAVVASNLTQEVLEVHEKDKYAALLKQLDNRTGTILVFVKTKADAENLSIRLNKETYNTCCIHGNLRQNKREQVMRAFRQGRYEIMIATDVVARGLDIPHVLHVINHDIPYAPEDYVHRIGRTARAGAAGFAISFVSPQDRKRWNAIQQLLNPGQYKFEQEEGRKQSSRNTNSRHHSQGNRGFSKLRSQGHDRFSQFDSPRSDRSSRPRSQGHDGFSQFDSSRSGRSSRPRSQGYEGASQADSSSQGRSSRPRSQGHDGFSQFDSTSSGRSPRSRSQAYEGTSQSGSMREGRSSRSRSQGHDGSSQFGSSRSGRSSKSRSQGHDGSSQFGSPRQDRSSRPRSEGYEGISQADLPRQSRSSRPYLQDSASKKNHQEVKFDKSSKRVTQRMEDTASSAGFNRNFSNKKSNYRKNY